MTSWTQPIFLQILSAETIFCLFDQKSQYMKVLKLFKWWNYSRAETIRRNTVCVCKIPTYLFTQLDQRHFEVEKKIIFYRKLYQILMWRDNLLKTLGWKVPSTNGFYVHSVSYVYEVLPFYDIKCLCSGGQEWGREDSH